MHKPVPHLGILYVILNPNQCYGILTGEKKVFVCMCMCVRKNVSVCLSVQECGCTQVYVCIRVLRHWPFSLFENLTIVERISCLYTCAFSKLVITLTHIMYYSRVRKPQHVKHTHSRLQTLHLIQCTPVKLSERHHTCQTHHTGWIHVWCKHIHLLILGYEGKSQHGKQN